MTRLRPTTKRVLFVFVICCAFNAAACNSRPPDQQQSDPQQLPPPSPWSDVEELLPSNGAFVDVMEMMGSTRLHALSARIMEAARKDQDWWLSHVKKSIPGELLAYDELLGVTKDEWEEFLKLGKEAVFEKVDIAVVKLRREAETIEFSFDNALPGFEGVKLDLKGDRVITPYGIAATRSRIEPNERQKAAGPMEGYLWTFNNVDEQTMRGTIIKVGLYKLLKNGRGMMSYEVKKLNDPDSLNLDFIIQYHLYRGR